MRVLSLCFLTCLISGWLVDIRPPHCRGHDCFAIVAMSSTRISQVELGPEKLPKMKIGLFLKTINILAYQMISGESKGVDNETSGLAPLQAQERVTIDTTVYGLPIGKLW